MFVEGVELMEDYIRYPSKLFKILILVKIYERPLFHF